MTQLNSSRSLISGPQVRQRGWIYQALGVEPIINCVGTQTNYGGSQPSQAVVNAMAAAAEAFVDLDELAEGVGRRLSILTDAGWGIVTSGSTAALSLATAACLAGNDPELMLQLPYLTGTNRLVLIPKEHRFEYDRIMAVVGAEVRDFSDLNDLMYQVNLKPRMICMLGRAILQGVGPALEDVRKAVGRVPIVVDAAGLSPQSPDPWLKRGADLVIYSGGKFLRGPQSTGFLLGREDLCRAAWVNGSPHQSFGRAMKVGKDEIIGALAALEDWLLARSENEDQAKWERVLTSIEEKTATLGLETEILNATSSVLAPRLRITWGSQHHCTADQVRHLALTKHRVRFPDFWSRGEAIEINPFNMVGDEDVDRVVECLRDIFCQQNPTSDTVSEKEKDHIDRDVSGTWRVSIEFLGRHRGDEFHLRQNKGQISGTHRSHSSIGQISGELSSEEIILKTCHESKPLSIYYSFRGALTGGSICGELTVGAASDEHRGLSLCSQFGLATFHAERIRRLEA